MSIRQRRMGARPAAGCGGTLLPSPRGAVLAAAVSFYTARESIRGDPGMPTRVLFVPALACAGLLAAAAARPAFPAFSVEQVLGAPFPSQLTAARQGERVAWVMDRHGERNVWVADGPDWVPRQVTGYVGDDGQPLASLRLTPDGQTVLYVRGTEVNEAGESANPASRAQAPKQQVWAVAVPPAPAPGEAAGDRRAAPRLLGDMGCPEEGCEDVQVSPDGRFAVWTAKHRLWLAPVAPADARAAGASAGGAT